MKKLALGKTGLEVTRIGFGTAPLGYGKMEPADAGDLLNGVLDAGINVIDSSHCYAASEGLIGQSISNRREEYVLVSKWGHHIEPDDPPAYSPTLVRHSLERSLKLTKTDHLDVLFMHGGTTEQLRNDEMLAAFDRCRNDGLTRFIGFSGDNEEAVAAVEMGIFDCLELSVNICDQQNLNELLPKADEVDLGVFVKRALANTCWRDLSNYGGVFNYANYASSYTDRLKIMGFTPDSIGFEGNWIELALRFTLFQDGVDTIMTGSRNLGHIRDNIAIWEQEPLPQKVQDSIHQIYRDCDDGSWRGMF